MLTTMSRKAYKTGLGDMDKHDDIIIACLANRKRGNYRIPRGMSKLLCLMVNLGTVNALKPNDHAETDTWCSTSWDLVLARTSVTITLI